MFWRFFSQLSAVFILTLLLFNQSLDRYIEQKYHVSFLQDSSFFISLGKPATKLSELFNQLLDSLQNQEISETQEIQPLPQENDKKPKIELTDKGLLIHETSQFLLIGDSMMQGVAITLIPELKKHGMRTLNLAKQSTGLTYNQFFNWPETLLSTLDQNPDIDVLVVMLGANDPWSIKRIKFGGDLWEQTYLNRIKLILQIAKLYDIPVFWYEVPLVKNKNLSDRIEYLNALYAKACEEVNLTDLSTEDFASLQDSPLFDKLMQKMEEVKKPIKFHAFFIQTNPSFSPESTYTPSITINEKSITIRANDGIHFTTKGSHLLTNLLVEKLDFRLGENNANEEENLDPNAQNQSQTHDESSFSEDKANAADSSHSSTPSDPKSFQ